VLDNELLRAIADKLNAPVNLQQDQEQQQPASSIPIWRQLGSRIDLTPNRLDIVELDAAAASVALQASIDAGLQPPLPVDRLDLPGYVMLRVWRDEDGGQPNALRMALRDMGRYDMASLVEIVAGLQPMAVPVATTTTGAPSNSGVVDNRMTPNAATSTNAGLAAAVQRAPAAAIGRPRLPPSTQALRQMVRAR
jgi:hypothetical protein